MTHSLASRNYTGLFVNVDWNSDQVGDHPERVVNPYGDLTISTYVPSEQLALSTGEKNLLFSGDYSLIILTELDVKDLANLSEVDKGSYLALKSNSIWDIQFQKFFPKAKMVDQSLCLFNAEEQFKIIYKWFKDELKPFVAQFNKNNEILLRLRGPNGWNGELNRLWKEFQEAGGIQATYYLRLDDIPFNNLTKEQQGHVEFARKAQKKLNLFQKQNYLRVDLGGSNYDGTRSTLSTSSKQGRILEAIEFMIPHIFSHQGAVEGAIRDSANAKNDLLTVNPTATAWIQDVPVLLADLGVFSKQGYSEQLHCTPDVLEKVGLSSLADLQALGLLNEPFVKEIEMPKDALSEVVSERNSQIYKRKEFCTELLNTLSEKIGKRIQESKPYNTIFSYDEKNPWVEYKKRVEEGIRSIREKCELPANLSKNYEQILKETNALIAEFNEQDRQYQITKLHAYIHQQDIRPQWKTLNDQGIKTLTQYVAQNPGVNLFKMGTGG